MKGEQLSSFHGSLVLTVIGLPLRDRGSTCATRVIFLPLLVSEVTSMSTLPSTGRPKCTGMAFCEQ